MSNSSDQTTLDQYRRMFQAACSALGEISDALGVDPDEGGAEPILAAIEELRATVSQREEMLEFVKFVVSEWGHDGFGCELEDGDSSVIDRARVLIAKAEGNGAPAAVALPADLHELLMHVVCDTRHPERQIQASRMLEQIGRASPQPPAQEPAEPLPPPGIHAGVHYATFLRREANKHPEPKAGALRNAARMMDVLLAEVRTLRRELVEAKAQEGGAA